MFQKGVGSLKKGKREQVWRFLEWAQRKEKGRESRPFVSSYNKRSEELPFVFGFEGESVKSLEEKRGKKRLSCL